MHFNPKMDMQKIVTLDGFGVRTDPREHFVKKRNFIIIGLVKDYAKNLGWVTYR